MPESPHSKGPDSPVPPVSSAPKEPAAPIAAQVAESRVGISQTVARPAEKPLPEEKKLANALKTTWSLHSVKQRLTALAGIKKVLRSQPERIDSMPLNQRISLLCYQHDVSSAVIGAYLKILDFGPQDPFYQAAMEDRIKGKRTNMPAMVKEYEKNVAAPDRERWVELRFSDEKKQHVAPIAKPAPKTSSTPHPDTAFRIQSTELRGIDDMVNIINRQWQKMCLEDRCKVLALLFNKTSVEDLLERGIQLPRDLMKKYAQFAHLKYHLLPQLVYKQKILQESLMLSLVQEIERHCLNKEEDRWQYALNTILEKIPDINAVNLKSAVQEIARQFSQPPTPKNPDSRP